MDKLWYIHITEYSNEKKQTTSVNLLNLILYRRNSNKIYFMILFYVDFKTRQNFSTVSRNTVRVGDSSTDMFLELGTN